MLITCRRERDGGRIHGAEDERQLLLRMAISEGAEYVDLEEDIATGIPRFGTTKRIVSLAQLPPASARSWKTIHRRLCQLDPDIVKIAALANEPADNLRMLELVAQQSTIPTVGICMGDMGVPSRILAGKFGAPFTFATFSSERALAPGSSASARWSISTATRRSARHGRLRRRWPIRSGTASAR